MTDLQDVAKTIWQLINGRSVSIPRFKYAVSVMLGEEAADSIDREVIVRMIRSKGWPTRLVDRWQDHFKSSSSLPDDTGATAFITEFLESIGSILP